jgi:hypothetical protein
VHVSSFSNPSVDVKDGWVGLGQCGGNAISSWGMPKSWVAAEKCHNAWLTENSEQNMGKLASIESVNGEQFLAGD